MFDIVFDNYGGPSMSSAIRVLGVVYCIIWDADITFGGKMGLGDQHYVHVTEGQVGFKNFSVAGEPIGVPEHDM
jgi:hypothetical protein